MINKKNFTLRYANRQIELTRKEIFCIIKNLVEHEFSSKKQQKVFQDKLASKLTLFKDLGDKTFQRFEQPEVVETINDIQHYQKLGWKFKFYIDNECDYCREECYTHLEFVKFVNGLEEDNSWSSVSICRHPLETFNAKKARKILLQNFEKFLANFGFSKDLNKENS